MNSIAERATSFSTAVETSLALDLSTPKFVLPLGRGRSGKSLLARWLVERARSQRRDVIVADADRINPSLAPYFQDALCLSGYSEDEILDWFSVVFNRQFTERLSSVADLGPGATPLEDLSALGVLSFLVEAGLQPVAIHLVGPDPADLSYLPYLDKLLPSAATIIVFNEALSDHPPENAFQPLISHPALKEATLRGAKTIWMPILEESSDIEHHRAAFASGEHGISPLGPLTKWCTALWLQKMETNFAPVAHLLP